MLTKIATPALRAAFFLPAISLGCLLLASPAAADGRKYYIEGYAHNCAGGTDEGMISVGNGVFSVESTVFKRRSSLKGLGDGWVEASYEASMEGEPLGEQLLRVKAEDASVTVRFPEGEVHGNRCH